MNVIRLYTTGNITGLTIHDMGELELIHPVSGLTINEFFTENEILNSQDLKDAISNEYIYLLDEYYKPIDDITKFVQTTELYKDVIYLTYDGVSGTTSGTMGCTLNSPGNWTITKFNTVYYLDDSGGDMIVIIPDADENNEGKSIYISKPRLVSSSNKITINTISGQNIAQNSGFTLYVSDDRYELISCNFGANGNPERKYRVVLGNNNEPYLLRVSQYSSSYKTLKQAIDFANILNKPCSILLEQGEHFIDNSILLNNENILSIFGRETQSTFLLPSENFPSGNTLIQISASTTSLSNFTIKNDNNISDITSISLIDIQNEVYIKFIDIKNFKTGIDINNSIVYLINCNISYCTNGLEVYNLSQLDVDLLFTQYNNIDLHVLDGSTAYIESSEFSNSNNAVILENTAYVELFGATNIWNVDTQITLNNQSEIKLTGCILEIPGTNSIILNDESVININNGQTYTNSKYVQYSTGASYYINTLDPELNSLVIDGSSDLFQQSISFSDNGTKLIDFGLRKGKINSFEFRNIYDKSLFNIDENGVIKISDIKTGSTFTTSLSINPLLFKKIYSTTDNINFTEYTENSKYSKQNEFTIFSSESDILYCGSYSPFNSIYFNLFEKCTSSNPKFEYWNGNSWIEITTGLSLVDNSNGFSENGYVMWNLDNINDWEKIVINSDGFYLYYIRITVSNLVGQVIANTTIPLQSRLQIFSAPLDQYPRLNITDEVQLIIGDSINYETFSAYNKNSFSIIDSQYTGVKLWNYSLSGDTKISFVDGTSLDMSQNRFWDIGTTTGNTFNIREYTNVWKDRLELSDTDIRTYVNDTWYSLINLSSSTISYNNNNTFLNAIDVQNAITELDTLRKWYTPGNITKINIIDNKDGTVTLSSAYTMIHSDDNFSSSLKLYYVSGQTLTLTPNYVNYIYIDYSGGTPIYKNTLNPLSINASNMVPAYRAYLFPDGHSHEIDYGVIGLSLPIKTARRILETDNIKWMSGLLLSENNRVISISSGLAYYGIDRKNLSEVTQNSANTFEWFHSGGNWVHQSVEYYNNTEYDDGIDKQLLSPDKYTVVWVFRDMTEHNIEHSIHYILGNNEYNLSDAINSSLPTIPNFIKMMTILVGKIVIGSGETSAYAVYSAFDQTLGSGGGVSNHNALTGIQGGAVNDYYHLTLSDYNTLRNGSSDASSLHHHNSLYYTKQEVYNTGQTYTITQINNILTGFTEITNFYNHTGNTNNPHETTFNNLTSTAHTHIIEDITNLQTELNLKTNLTYFNSHTGDTTIHFTKESILFNDLNDVDTGGALDNYFVYYTGGTWKSRSITHNELIGRNDWNQHSLSSITWKNDANDLYPQYNNVQTILSNYLSSTSINGFDLTDNGDGTINIGYGSAVMRMQDLETSELIGTYFSGQTNISLTNNTTNYIYISYSGGTLHLVVDTDIVDEIGLSKLPIYFINRVDNNLDIVDMRFYGRNYITKNAKKDFFLYGYEHQPGGSVISDNTTVQGQVKFNVSNGTFFVASNQINHDNFDSDTDTFTYIYGSGGTYTKITGSTILDYSHWDNSGVLSSATLNYYTVHYLYVILDYRTGFTNYAIVYGRGEYDSLESAKSAPVLTTDLSPEVGLYSTGRFIGKLITKNESGGPTSIADIQSPFTTILTSSVATTHNTLSGLQGGMSNQYYHLTQTDYNTLTKGFDASTLHNHNTQYYTKTQSDSNYLSANTFNNIINTNGINNNGNITATTYYGDGSHLTGISTTTTLSALTDTTINNPQTGHTLIYSGNTWLNSMYDWNYLINTPISVTFEEATGGTLTTDRLWSPERVKQAIESLSGGEEQDLPSLSVLIDGSHSLSTNGVYAVIPFVIKQLENEPTIIKYTSSTGFTIYESGVYMISFNSNAITPVSQSLGIQIRKNNVLISGGTSVISVYKNEQHEFIAKVVTYVESGSTISVYGASSTSTSGVIGNGGLNIVKMSALKGAVGPKGDKGDKGADGDITWEGNWSISSGYTKNQAVYYQGTSYVCILDNTGQIPTTASTYWDVLALKGEAGGIDLSIATGILSVEKGGTNITGYTQGDILYASNSTTLVKLPKGTSGQTLMMNSGATAPEWQSAILGTYFQEVSNDTQINFTNKTYLQRLNITTPNLPNGKYRVGWNAEVTTNNTNNSIYIRIQHNDTTTYNKASIEPKDTINWHSVSGFFYVTISGVNTFDMDYRVNGNTGRLRYARMEFWRIS
ncbi:MAG: hypothetical protein HPY57_13950 [Ignavibacteria bacterium]|nr:hypothetical protein [Ignavibacteria bacterium]